MFGVQQNAAQYGQPASMITEYNGQKFEMMAPGPNNPGGIMNTMPGMGAPVAPAPAPAQAPAPAPAQAPAPAPAQAQAQAPPAGNTTVYQTEQNNSSCCTIL